MLDNNDQVKTSLRQAATLGQSDFAYTHLVVGAQLTPARRLKQAIVEFELIDSKVEDIDLDIMELTAELMEINADKELQQHIEGPTPEQKEASRVRLAVETRRVTKARDKAILAKANLVYTANHLSTLLSECLKHCGLSTENLKEESFPMRLRSMLEAEEGQYYAYKLALDTHYTQISQSLCTNKGVIESMAQLPQEHRQQYTDLLDALGSPVLNVLPHLKQLAALAGDKDAFNGLQYLKMKQIQDNQ